jgi:hypothetical protein
VGAPPRARGTMWSSSSRWVEPHASPDGRVKVHRPPSRFQTSRRTWAGTWSGLAGRMAFCGFAVSPLRWARSVRS